MTRGDFVTIAMQGDFGKPRPALVIQADHFGEHATVTVLPVTSTLVAPAPLLRVTVQPSAANGFTEAVTGDGGQGHDRETRQGGASLRANQR